MGGFASAKALSPAMTTRPLPVGHGTRIATALCSAKVPACWCSRSTSTRSSAVRASTPSSGFGMSGDVTMTAPDTDGPVDQHGLGDAERGHQSGSGALPQRPGTSAPSATRTKPKRSSSLLVRMSRSRWWSTHQVDDGSSAGRPAVWSRWFTVLAVHHQVSPPTINASSSRIRGVIWITVRTSPAR